ncbi:hypothetical protein AC626_24900, partial [Pseudoalteromonas rubra]
GLMNTQFAVKDGQVYLIEVNPRAARTVPFVSKATGVALAKVAARCMVGQSLESQGVTKEVIPPYYSVKKWYCHLLSSRGLTQCVAQRCVLRVK